MAFPKIRYTLGAILFALVASTVTPSLGAAAATPYANCVTITHDTYACSQAMIANNIPYYICPNGTVQSGLGGQGTCGAPTAVVEKPVSAPPPTVAEATPPLNIICKAPFVPTLHAGTWACIVPKAYKLSQ